MFFIPSQYPIIIYYFFFTMSFKRFPAHINNILYSILHRRSRISDFFFFFFFLSFIAKNYLGLIYESTTSSEIRILIAFNLLFTAELVIPKGMLKMNQMQILKHSQ